MARQADSSNTEPCPAALRFNASELSGGLGDLGTFIPLLVGMVNKCGLQFGPALLFAGLMNVASGLMFGIPIPVQPMKVVAAVAIAEGLNESQILAAGILVGLVVLVAALTGLIRWLARAIPKSVVRGLQLALGLKLLTKGLTMIVATGVIIGPDSISLAVLCALIVLAFSFSTRVPTALIVFAIGIAALMVSRPELLSHVTLGMAWHLPDLTHMRDWLQAFWRGALPQIPLTVLNSVIAVCALSGDLLPRREASPTKVAVSVGLMNLLCCPFGAMPMCHGAGGLAAQYRFGARTGGSVVMLGAIKTTLAVLLGASLLTWVQAYPGSILGVLLAFSGLELSLVCRDQHCRVDFFVMILTAGACMATNTAVGFVVGWVLAALLIWGVLRLEPVRDNDTPEQ